ncbi:MAG: hydroxyacylglutathione hydrolase [Acidiferrobacterales bacterium]|nr:hydroxyacylglutathione hydrolase [Acidiferrobacterales bacterium]
MLVEQIPVNNNLRNYMYLIACPETKEAAALDPLDHAVCLQRAQDLGWTIRSVINTHEHHDHIDGNEPIIEATGATLYAHHKAVEKIPNVDVALVAGDVVQVGTSVRLISLDTPGHTFCHTCLYYEGNNDTPPALFCGDTLFNAGAGNCHQGGDPQTLYQTFAEQIHVLKDETKIYPGHDYIVNNLEFTLDREPDNAAAKSLLAAMHQWNGENHFISNIAMEKAVNTFFRLSSETLISKLKAQFTDIQESPSEETVFLKLRELRNNW